jgi:hypothetical protein
MADTLSEEPKAVRIRVTWESQSLYDQEFVATESELLQPNQFTQYPILYDNTYLGSLPAIGAVAGVVIDVGGLTSLLGRAVQLFHTPPVRIFIETTIAGSALTVLTKKVIDSVCTEVAKRVAESKLKRAKVLLYGPDNKEINWR